MENRPIKTLLELLLKQVNECPESWFYGICGEILVIDEKKIISRGERKALTFYMDHNKPVKRYAGYWWKRENYTVGVTTGHNKSHRVDWLKQEIIKTEPNG